MCSREAGLNIRCLTGTVKISELKTGEALIRPPVTHSDEALDDVETILVENKQ
jgi:hypothetical protein